MTPDADSYANGPFAHTVPILTQDFSFGCIIIVPKEVFPCALCS